MTFLGVQDAYFNLLHRCGLSGTCNDHLERWSNRLQATTFKRSSLQGTIFHLYHGNLADRSYISRHFDLLKTGFLADEHLELDAGGAWRFNDAAPEASREMMARYFASRREDGRDEASVPTRAISIP